MAQTSEGAKKTAATNKAKYGDDYYARIGKLGGSVKTPYKGFGADKRNLLEKLFRKPKKAQLAGRKGGKISKRGPGGLSTTHND